jgi:hypothetical protein
LRLSDIQRADTEAPTDEFVVDFSKPVDRRAPLVGRWTGVIMRSIALTAAAIVCIAAQTSAQQPPPAAPAVRPAVPRARPAAAAPVAARITVRDQTGAALSDVKITLSGVSSGEMSTNGFGTSVFPNLKDGVYRLRFDREGYIPLEREFTVHAPQPIAIEVQLTPAPPPPAPPPAPAPPPSRKLSPGGKPVTLSIPAFLDKNLIGGRDPLKESVISCGGDETVRLLQLREALGEHAHADMDEVLYVVAGEGAIRLGSDVSPISAGSVSVVPHGTLHAIERRGKNPLILLSTLSGAPCKAAQ